MKKVIILAWQLMRVSLVLAPTSSITLECPAEGQSLQRGHVWNMPVFSLMTHITINTLQLSRPACVHGRVYWLLASVPWRIPVSPSWSSSRLELEALQPNTWAVQWSPAATQAEADTHSSTEWKWDTSAIFNLTWRTARSFVVSSLAS